MPVVVLHDIAHQYVGIEANHKRLACFFMDGCIHPFQTDHSFWRRHHAFKPCDRGNQGRHFHPAVLVDNASMRPQQFVLRITQGDRPHLPRHLPNPPHRRIDPAEIEGLGIEIPSQPLQHLLMLLP